MTNNPDPKRARTQTKSEPAHKPKADWLSKVGHSIPVNLLMSECEATEFRTIIQEDWVGRTLVRRGS